jgi:hypothetical protein
MSILHIKSFENHGDEGFLANTDAGTDFLKVDFDTGELAYWALIRDLEFYCEPGLDFDCSFGCVFWVQH